MWNHTIEQMPWEGGYKVGIVRDSAPLAYAEAIDLWRFDAAFRLWFNGLLAASPYPAFRWETPPITEATASRRFEFVILDSPRLARKPDDVTFSQYFRGESVVCFPTLGGDGLLVVPCPMGERGTYVQIGDFVRQTPPEQIDALWRLVGEKMYERLNDRPVWLSTAGGGVAWLHVRLDDHPKYYHYGEYRQRP